MKFTKTAFTFLCLSFLLSCSKDTPETTPTPVPVIPNNVNLAKGLVAYYPFNGNTNDESGNNNPGSLINGSSLIHDQIGRAQSALNVNGNGQKMLVQNNGKIKFDTAMTISFHVMPRAINRSNIIGMTENSSARGTSFVIGPALPGNNNLIYSITNNEVTCDAFVNSNQVSFIDAGVMLQIESWYNVVCIYNKGTMKQYINGVLISTRSSKDNKMQTCPNAQLLIGGWWNQDPSASFNGKIDEVRLYDRELHVDEIKELAKNFK
jgi:hypothetical protein